MNKPYGVNSCCSWSLGKDFDLNRKERSLIKRANITSLRQQLIAKRVEKTIQKPQMSACLLLRVVNSDYIMYL